MKSSQDLILKHFAGEFFTPVNWEEGLNIKNYFARITLGKKGKFLFNRAFINHTSLDDAIVFKEKYFPNGEIIEFRSTYAKGQKKELLFSEFYIIRHINSDIYGEIISQKDALEYFSTKDKLPDIANGGKGEEQKKNQLHMKLGTVIRKLHSKYGDMVLDVLSDIMSSYFPDVPNNVEEGTTAES